MNRSVVGLAALAMVGATVAGIRSVQGGMKSTQTVFLVNNGINGGYAYGDLGAVRNSADSSQMIACGAQGHSPGGTNATVVCWGYDSTLHYFSCLSAEVSVAQAVMAMTDSSEIFFQWDGSGHCQSVEVYNSSSYRPPTP